MNTDKLHILTALKLFRQATGEGLWNAKQLVEATIPNARAGVDASALGKAIHQWYMDHRAV